MIEPIVIRLTKGQDLKTQIQSLVTKHAIQAGSIASCVGSLEQVTYACWRHTISYFDSTL